MGESKRRSSTRQEFLKKAPWCIYCGAAATTIDHCPPRSFFAGRHWPETYEFPACEPCNADNRLDEQALSVLVRSGLTQSSQESDRIEWERLARGVRNNQQAVFAEWKDIRRNEVRNGLRRAFGRDGDERRRQGWGLINLGPLTKAILTRFMIKLTKALYFRHNEHIFDGVAYIYHINKLSADTTPDYINSILKMAPETPKIERNKKTLIDQFIYQFNHSPEHRVMYAVVQFGEQFIFQLVAASRDIDEKLLATQPNEQAKEPLSFRHECFLRSPRIQDAP